MVAYGKRQFELNAKQKDNATLREHLTVAWNATGIKPEQLDYEELPENVQYLWSWFLDLHSFRGSNGFGANPIDPSLIRDWCWLTGVILEPFEVRAIRVLDMEYMAASQKESKG